MKYEQELFEQKEEYGKLLREENLKWKSQREELENEISKLKKTPTTIKNQKTSNDADLTAFIKDLKESANTLSSNGKAQGKRSTTNAYGASSTNSNSRLIGNVIL
jgi:predicted  nucleic acid-binding Zn-ribbon protein